MKKRWQVVLAFTGVFLAGAVVGSTISIRYVREMARHKMERDQFTPQMMKRFAERLELTAEQRAKILPIVNRCSNSIRKVRRDGLIETSALIERMHDDVSRQLTKEQREKLGKMRERQRQRFREWLGNREHKSDDRQTHHHPPRNPELRSIPAPAPPEDAPAEPVSEPAHSE